MHRLPDGRVIIVVADGVSEAPQSHIGASIAVKQTVEWLRSNLGHDAAGTDWPALAKNTAYALAVSAQSLFGLAEPDPVRAEQELATTLVCAVIEPIRPGGLRGHFLAVGDSGAWVLSSANEFVQVIGGKAVAESSVASSAVAALPPNTHGPHTCRCRHRGKRDPPHRHRWYWRSTWRWKRRSWQPISRCSHALRTALSHRVRPSNRLQPRELRR